MPKRNILPALFDVKPKRGLGDFTLQREIDLRPRPLAKVAVQKPLKKASIHDQIFAQAPRATGRDIVANEVESALTEEHLMADLVRSGATMHEQVPQDRHARPRVIEPVSRVSETAPQGSYEVQPQEVQIQPQDAHPQLEEFWANGGSATLARASYEPAYSNPFPAHAMPPPVTHLSPAARNVEVLLSQMSHPKLVKVRKDRRWFTRRRALIILLVISIVGVGGFAVSTIHAGEFVAKQNVLQNGSNALANLEAAKTNLEAFDFAKAADNFALANDDFEKASGTLSNLGASFISMFGSLPGLNKVKSATNLVQAGQNISKAGENLSLAVSGLYKTNFFALIGDPVAPGDGELLNAFQDFRSSLLYAGKNVDNAASLLQDIDASTIPEDKQVLFTTFKDKIPDFKAYIGKAVEYSDFLLGFIGESKPKTYMILLQNTSEKRPTGGFPGTYAIISFDKGELKKIFIDDIYNPDGQIRENIIPPGPIRHITPNWGMRDVNWFADYPTSAKKIEEFYLLDGGAKLDGVFALDPTVIARILELIGPIEMPEYGVTLDSHNFLASIQDEVEYKADRAQPKKIVTDFQPRFFEKLAAQDKARWMDIMKVLLDSLQQKHILAYFNDSSLQREVLADGFAGEIKSPPASDYLQVAISNVKGSKSDAVTANAMRLTTEIDAYGVKHMLAITRAHNGGKSQYAFYNKDNPAYIKVYVPKGSLLSGIDGMSKPNYQPLISYSDLGFKPDPLLQSIEATATHPFDGVDVFEESGKTVFGFWLVVKPQKTMTVNLSYRIPDSTMGLNNKAYSLYWQKQSGSDGDQMHISAQLPDGAVLATHSPDAQVLGNSIVLDGDLTVDHEFKFSFN